MASYLITGANRGIGLELVTQLAEAPSSQVSIVFAASRQSEPSDSRASSPLQNLIDASSGRVVHVPMVITSRTSLDKAAAEVEAHLAKLGHGNGDTKGLDVLINNAGVMPPSFQGIAKMDNLRYALEVNVEAVHETIAAFLPLLQRGTLKKVVNITTTLGSITQAPKYTWAPFPAYKISKAAMNMLTVLYAQEYAKEGFTIFGISPGWLKTEMGSQQADLDVDVGVKAVLDNIFQSTPEKYNGTFQNVRVPGWENKEGPNQYDGKVVPW
ncbi:hypothetical protein LTR67_007908 [Exophiala xenobiotica]